MPAIQEIPTRTLDQLAELAVLAPADLVPVQRGVGPAQRASVQALVDYITANIGTIQGAKGDPGGNVSAIGPLTATALMSIDAGAGEVRTTGFATTGDGGRGTWGRVSAEPAHPGKFRSADRFLPDGTSSAADGGWWELVSLIDVRVFGAGLGDDDTTAFQDAVDMAAITGRKGVFVPKGAYNVGTVQIGPSALIPTRSGIYIQGESKTDSNITATSTDFVFDCLGYSTGENDGPIIRDIAITGRNGIRINNEATTIADGSGDPYVMRAEISGCRLYGDGDLGGFGILWSKCFDGKVARNLVQNFGSGVCLHGSDINSVYDNRIVNPTKFGLVDQSAGTTFGSMNRIDHNEFILRAETTPLAAIMSTAQHVLIRDNYFEATEPLAGFIDVSATNALTFGANAPADTLTIRVEGNRLDGQQYANSFVGRYEAGQATTVVIRNLETVGGIPGFTPASFFMGGNRLLARATVYHNRHLEVWDPSFGPAWHGYRSENCARPGLGGEIAIDSRHVYALTNNFANDEIRFDGRWFIVPAGTLTNLQYFYFTPNAGASGADGDNYLFDEGAAYTVEIHALSTVAGDKIDFGLYSGAGGGPLYEFTLDDQMKLYSFDFTAPAKGVTSVGVYGRCFDGTGDVRFTLTIRPRVIGGAVADAAPISGGEPPTEAEFNALATQVNALLAELRAVKTIAT